MQNKNDGYTKLIKDLKDYLEVTRLDNPMVQIKVLIDKDTIKHLDDQDLQDEIDQYIDGVIDLIQEAIENKLSKEVK